MPRRQARLCRAQRQPQGLGAAVVRFPHRPVCVGAGLWEGAVAPSPSQGPAESESRSRPSHPRPECVAAGSVGGGEQGVLAMPGAAVPAGGLESGGCTNWRTSTSAWCHQWLRFLEVGLERRVVRTIQRFICQWAGEVPSTRSGRLARSSPRVFRSIHGAMHHLGYAGTVAPATS